jgi:hypothetical protein
MSYSRMFVSEGCAVMYGGGFSVMLLYSRVNCARQTIVSLAPPSAAIAHWGFVKRTRFCAARLAMSRD